MAEGLGSRLAAAEAEDRPGLAVAADAALAFCPLLSVFFVAGARRMRVMQSSSTPFAADVQCAVGPITYICDQPYALHYRTGCAVLSFATGGRQLMWPVTRFCLHVSPIPCVDDNHKTKYYFLRPP